MTSAEIRQSFLKFFEERGHTIVPSSPVVPYDDPTLLFTNAGMNQFKDVFLGTGRRPYKRAADTQKCIRVSGKHNDLEEVGRDTYHHTFFEMLGNWSFGDYYKKEAIEWGWELLTKVWGLPKSRLWATVYKDDDEAEELWKKVTDINPGHVLRFGEKVNFWEMGETGPCGPCSEIHIDLTPNGNATADLVNAGRPDLMEIWNLVFIQYDRDASGKLTPLPAKHVDTGMGFERICAVLQRKKSNYDTDVFTPLLNAISEIANRQYTGKLESETDVAFRVIADHVRALTFAIADGALPSNEGRGYVLRRLLRRAARFARSLDLHEPCIYRLVPTIVETMGQVFPEVKEKQEHIQKVIKGEEEGFNATLDRGLEIFEQVAAKAQKSGSKRISGEDSFKLYDTYGFPLDLTQLLAREKGLSVDEAGFNNLLEAQRERSREAGKGTGTQVGSKVVAKGAQVSHSEFTGYDTLEDEGTIVQLVDEYLILDRTPFYGESGGQVGDTGILKVVQKLVRITDTQRDGTLIIHKADHVSEDFLGQKAIAQVEKERRLAIMRNHTATHLVHAALRKILGTHVHQAGSLVAPDHLRFDFAHFSKVSEEELRDIEALVNEKINERITLTHYRDIPFEEAKKMGALMFFGDKYGERVNVVEFGDFSREFCGGTHVTSTAEIGYFKLRSEGSVASGVRRIEAVTDQFALELLKLQEKSFLDRLDFAVVLLEDLTKLNDELRSISKGSSVRITPSFTPYEKRLDELKSSKQSSLLDSKNLRERFENRSVQARRLEDLILELTELRKGLEKELTKFRVSMAALKLDELINHAIRLNGIRLVAAKVQAGTMDELKSLGDTLRTKLGSGVGVLGAIVDDKVALVCVVTDDLLSSQKLNAGQVVGSVAKLVGGGGGGRPHMATAGGKDVQKLDEALQQTESIVKSLLHH